MVVGCPKCKVKLKVADEKVKPEGLKIKCPKCSTILMVRKPAAPPSTRAPQAPKAAPAAPPPTRAPEAPKAAPKPAPEPAQPSRLAPQAAPTALRAPMAPQPIEAQAKQLNPRKVLVAHENAMVVEEVMGQLMKEGYLVIPVPNGVDTLVQVMKELPFVVMLDAALPKIDGYEIIKRLKEKEDTKEIKTIIISSKSDDARQRKNPASMYGVNAYIDDEDVPVKLMKTMEAVISGKALPVEETAPPKPQAVPSPPKPAAVPPSQPSPQAAPSKAPESAPVPPKPAAAPVKRGIGSAQPVEKARRLARTVLSDIDLYDPEKVLESIRNGQFEAVFANELREGLKHYQMRIPKDVRAQGNFFQESLDAFIAKKKEKLNL